MPEMKTLTVNGTKYEVVDEAARNLANSHASRHAAGGADPITASMIGAAGLLGANTHNDLNNFTRYGCARFYNGAANLPNTAYNAWNVWNNGDILQGWFTQFASVVNNPEILYKRDYADGTWTGWKQLATTDYALARDGSNEMTGMLGVKETVNISSVTTDTTTQLIQNSGNTYLRNKVADNNITDIVLGSSGKAKVQKYDGSAYTSYDILHTGNKPTGSYTGNGDATARTIATGGIGKVLYIQNINGFALVNNTNGAYFDGSGYHMLPYADAHFVNGVLTLATTNLVLNANGSTNEYQVL